MTLSNADNQDKRRLIESLAERLSGFRSGERNVQRGPDHVERWLSQFSSEAVQLHIVRAVDRLMANEYFTEKKLVEEVFPRWADLLETEGFQLACSGEEQHFLETQTGSRRSQAILLESFRSYLVNRSKEERHRIDSIKRSAPGRDRFIYLDDGIFTGQTMFNELEKWINDSAPQDCDLLVLTVVAHERGFDRLFGENGKVRHAIQSSGKKIRLLTEKKFFHRFYDDRIKGCRTWDTYRPTCRPVFDSGTLEASAHDALHTIGQDIDESLRPQAGSAEGVFGQLSPETRHVVEQEFCRVGLRILARMGFDGSNQDSNHRPLGYGFKGFGLGSPCAWEWNCPNNAPLALWKRVNPSSDGSDPGWYPLLPRRGGH